MKDVAENKVNNAKKDTSIATPEESEKLGTIVSTLELEEPLCNDKGLRNFSKRLNKKLIIIIVSAIMMLLLCVTLSLHFILKQQKR